VVFQMGSPESEPKRNKLNEATYLCRIPRSFALGTKEVTVAEFRRFLESNSEIKKTFDEGNRAAELLKDHSPEQDGPIILVDWYTAAEYCNWLSKEEGLPEAEWCYPKDVGKIRERMTMEKVDLNRKGYRLPTEAEWEYGCRAGAITSRYYGRSKALLNNYAWYLENPEEDRARPVGRLRPNDLGLFDMLGNVTEWCHSRWVSTRAAGVGAVVEDVEDTGTAKDDRALRSGGFIAPSSHVRSALRYGYRPAQRLMFVGLRVAKTCD
jgi:formylglycine-generating enzyme required for sulfatase activity